MTFTDAFPRWPARDLDATERTDPPQKRVTPPLFMGDILMSRRGIPVFVEEWMRLERERDERRKEAALKQALLGEDAADRR